MATRSFAWLVTCVMLSVLCLCNESDGFLNASRPLEYMYRGQAGIAPPPRLGSHHIRGHGMFGGAAADEASSAAVGSSQHKSQQAMCAAPFPTNDLAMFNQR